MTLTERIAADLADAMKRKDAERVDTLRMLRAAVKNAEIDKGRALADEEVVAVLRTSTKQLKDALEQFRAGKREDLAGKNERELAVLGAYLPAELSDADLAVIVDRAVAAGGGDFGKVMGAVMAEVKGKADGSRVSASVRARLARPT